MKNCLAWGLVCLSTIFFAEPSIARTIKIVSPGKGINLTNPSTISVNFDISCFDKNGAQLLNLTNQTLAPNASKSFGLKANISDFSPSSLACSNNDGIALSCGAVAAVACPGEVPFQSAESLCSAGLQICNYSQISAMNLHGGSSTQWYWVAHSGNMYFTSSPCGWTTNYTLSANDAVLIGQSCGTAIGGREDKCNTQENITDMRNYCSYGPKTENRGAICCGRTTGASACSVKINTTATDAFLASPEFKGGAPF